MVLLQVLSILVLGSGLGSAYIPPMFPPCTWKSCTAEWRNDWGPGIQQGTCTRQHRNEHISYTTHHGPYSPYCMPEFCWAKTQSRTMCEYDIVFDILNPSVSLKTSLCSLPIQSKLPLADTLGKQK